MSKAIPLTRYQSTDHDHIRVSRLPEVPQHVGRDRQRVAGGVVEGGVGAARHGGRDVRRQVVEAVRHVGVGK